MRKKSGYLTLLVLALAGGFVVLRNLPQPTVSNPIPAGTSSIEVHFSPKGGCADAIIAAIDDAKTSLDVQAYSFTSAPIAQAVASAHQRGVAVRVVLDKSQKTEKYSSATFLKNHSVPVLIDSKHNIAHNKIILIDSRVVITGSFNFSKNAEEENAENLLIIRDNPELYSKYADNFSAHLAHSVAY